MLGTTMPEAIIHLRGHTAFIRGVSADVLDQVLTVKIITSATDDDGVLRLTRREMLLYAPLGAEYLFPAGLSKRVETYLAGQGLPVQVIDQTICPTLKQAARLPGPQKQDPANQRWWEIFSTLPRAQIVVRSRRQMIRAIAACAMVHPQARILVIAKNNDQARAIAGGLTELMPDRVRLLALGIQWCDRIVLVSNSYHPVGAGNQQYEIVVYVGPETPISQIGQVEAAKMHGQLRYCVRYPWRTDITPYEELHVEAACGPVEFVERSSKFRTLRVWFVAFPGRQRPRASTAADRKRIAYWNNQQRNRLICRAVEALKSRDSALLEQLGLAAAEARRLVELLPADPDIAIVVESLEHARVLQEAFPRNIICGQLDAEWSDRCVVCDVSLLTESFARRVPIIAEVILRASGGTSELMLPQGRGLDRDDAPQSVIDIWDDFDPRGSAKRAADYREQGAEVKLPAVGRQQAAHRRSRK